MATAVAKREIWGEDDCFEWLAPAGKVRPKWLAECETVGRAIVTARKKFGSEEKAYESFAKRYGMKRVTGGFAKIQPGDRVVGTDANRGVVAAVVFPDFGCYIRTPNGAERAVWTSVASVWRLRDSTDE